MRDVRNTEKRLVCRVDDEAGEIVIKTKDCITKLKLGPDGLYKEEHIKIAA